MRCGAIVTGVLVIAVAACSPGSSSHDSGTPVASPDASAGTSDAGVAPSDAGSGAGGGQGSGGSSAACVSGAGDQGSGGVASAECDGLVPPAPGVPTEFVWSNRDLNSNSGGYCFPAEVDGTGHIAISWQHAWQPHDSSFVFLDSADGSQAGAYGGVRLLLYGQLSGFMGANCYGGGCAEDYVVVDPVGKELYRSAIAQDGTGIAAPIPTGGMMLVRRFDLPGKQGALLDSIDASGTVRWSRQLPPLFGLASGIRIGVDRKANVLAVWATAIPYNTAPWNGQWFDAAGNAGPVFQFLSSGAFPERFYERVGDGLFLSGFVNQSRVWLGQFDAQATTMSPPPCWLAARPGTALHMVHGGNGYAVLPPSQASASCEQQVDIISPSGQLCGTSTFSISGGSCTTSSIVVGYDGTVVQQGPRERETCTMNDHICTCTYRFWRGYFH